jgi:hypothetical protein
MVTLRNDCRTDTPGSTKKTARAPSGNPSAFLNSTTVAESSPAPADARRFPRYLKNTPRGILPAMEHLIPLNFSPVATPRLSQRRIMSQSDRRVELPHDLKKSPTRLTRTSVLTIMLYTQGYCPIACLYPLSSADGTIFHGFQSLPVCITHCRQLRPCRRCSPRFRRCAQVLRGQSGGMQGVDGHKSTRPGLLVPRSKFIADFWVHGGRGRGIRAKHKPILRKAVPNHVQWGVQF